MPSLLRDGENGHKSTADDFGGLAGAIMAEGHRRRSMTTRNERIISARNDRQYFEALRAPAGAISCRGGVPARVATYQARRAESGGVPSEKANPR